MILLIQSFLLAVTASEECWWSGCQLDSWAEQGCFPQDQWQAVNKTPCLGGNFYKCCKSETIALKNSTSLKSERSDCWWSGCQPYEWGQRGCFPEEQWQSIESVKCDNGDKFHCCKKEENLSITTRPPMISGAKLSAECWWSGCQPLEWAERGCFPSDQWEQVNSTNCEPGNGNIFLCCRKHVQENTTNEEKTTTAIKVETSIPSNNDVEMNFQEFKRAVVDCGYDTPTEVQYKALISQAKRKGGINSKRELAMFLAQILWESGGLKYRREIACEVTGCPGVYDSSVGIPGKNYYGRGYIQLTHSFNYKAASYDLFSDDRLIKNPDLVADDERIAWATAFWFWKRNVHNRAQVQKGLFGASTNAINGLLECVGPHKDRARKRFELYKIVLRAFNVTEPPNETGCYN